MFFGNVPVAAAGRAPAVGGECGVPGATWRSPGTGGDRGREGSSLERGESEKGGAQGAPEPEMGAWRGGTPRAGSEGSVEKAQPGEEMSLERGNPGDTKVGTPERGGALGAPAARSRESGEEGPLGPQSLGIPQCSPREGNPQDPQQPREGGLPEPRSGETKEGGPLEFPGSLELAETLQRRELQYVQDPQHPGWRLMELI